jgi:prevent-host-death family protein
MRTITATEASRGFSDLLDAVERGESVRIRRGNHTVAEIVPARRSTVATLKAAMASLAPLDDDFESDIAGALAMLEPITPGQVDEWTT